MSKLSEELAWELERQTQPYVYTWISNHPEMLSELVASFNEQYGDLRVFTPREYLQEVMNFSPQEASKLLQQAGLE